MIMKTRAEHNRRIGSQYNAYYENIHVPAHEENRDIGQIAGVMGIEEQLNQ